MSPIQTITTLRAGTMFTWELLGLNFVGVPTGVGSIKPHHTHMRIDDAIKHGWYRTLYEAQKPTVYILRDIRDVLVSQFYFMVDLQTDFHGFLHGRANPRSMISSEDGPVPTPSDLYPVIQERIREAPIHAWVEHTQWIHEGWVDFYKYEDIVECQEAFISYLKRRYNLKLYSSKVEKVERLVGIKPRKGIVGDWKNHFTDSDLDYVWHIAGSRMEEFGYKRDGTLV
jgi:hypothetical protein